VDAWTTGHCFGGVSETDARTEVTLMLGGIRIYYSISPSPPEKNVPQLTAALFDRSRMDIWIRFGSVSVSVLGIGFWQSQLALTH